MTEYQPRPQAFHEDRMVFNPDAERSRRTIEPMFLLENVSDADDEQHFDWSDGLPSPKRARIDERGLLAEAVLAYSASIDGVPETPYTYAEAIACDEAAEWRQEIDAELQSHSRNQTWTLVPRGTATRPIGCCWVFAKKRDENGRVIRYKARLVA